MQAELLSQQLETLAASIQRITEQPYMLPLVLVAVGTAYGFWHFHQHIVDLSRRVRTRERFSKINEHVNRVPTPDEFVEDLNQLSLGDYAKDPAFRKDVQDAINRVAITKKISKLPRENGSGNTRP